VFPLVEWIWIGVVVLIGGTLVALVPSKLARSYPRTQVVGQVVGVTDKANAPAEV
jgi:cytochrome c biogenesis factor